MGLELESRKEGLARAAVLIQALFFGGLDTVPCYCRVSWEEMLLKVEFGSTAPLIQGQKRWNLSSC